MKLIYSLIISIVLVLYLTGDQSVLGARGGRGGGGRSGGSRGGGGWGRSSRGRSSRSRSSRSSRSGNTKVRVSVRSRRGYQSSRYSSWSARSGVSINVRYKTGGYFARRDAILTGMILMSYHHRARVRLYSNNEVRGMSVCINGNQPLYGRNLTASPWFVCPWENNNAYYCCGSEFEEYCCSYFQRPSSLAGLIIGMIILFFFLIGICCFFRSTICRKSSYMHRQPSTHSVVVTVKTDHRRQSSSSSSSSDTNIKVAVTQTSMPYPDTGSSPPYPTNEVPPYPMDPVNAPLMMPQAPQMPMAMDSTHVQASAPDPSNLITPPPSYDYAVNQ